MAVGEVGDVGRGELPGVLAEGGGEQFGVVEADAEGQQRAAVADDGVVGGWVELASELVAENQPEAVLAGLGEHDGGRGGDQRLELVEV